MAVFAGMRGGGDGQETFTFGVVSATEERPRDWFVFRTDALVPAHALVGSQIVAKQIAPRYRH